MEISNAHFHHLNHHQAMAGHPLEEALGCPRSQQQQQQQQQQDQKKTRPQPEQSLKCPRCDSTNTKFCYYNNYSLSQPRYFCKGCRRYWTQGGSLRNVPVGGGCRKNKRSSSNSNSNSNSNSSAKVKSQDNLELITTTNTNTTNNNHQILPSLPLPPLSYDPCSDLTLAFANDSTFLLSNPNPNPSPNPSSGSHGGFLDILRGGFVDPSTLCYAGFGGKEVEGGGDDQQAAAAAAAGVMNMFPFDHHGVVGGEAAASSGGVEENKVQVMGVQWPAVGGDANLSMDSGVKDYYWNGVGSSTWHGIINSSLM